MNIHARFLVFSLGVVAFGAMGAAGCGSSPSTVGSSTDGGSSSSASSSAGVDAGQDATSSSSSSSVTSDAGDAGEEGDADAGHDSGETDAGDAGHDSGTEGTDAGDAGHDSGTQGTDAGDAGDASVAPLTCGGLSCAAGQVCCLGYADDGGGASCTDEATCTLSLGGDSFACTEQANCTTGQVCCVTLSTVTTPNTAQCESTSDCAGAGNTNYDTSVTTFICTPGSVGDGDCTTADSAEFTGCDPNETDTGVELPVCF